MKLFFLHKLVPPWTSCSVIICSGTARPRSWMRGGLRGLQPCCIQETSSVWGTGSVHPAWNGLIKHRLKRSLLKKNKTKHTNSRMHHTNKQTREQKVKTFSAKACAHWWDSWAQGWVLGCCSFVCFFQAKGRDHH